MHEKAVMFKKTRMEISHKLNIAFSIIINIIRYKISRNTQLYYV